MRRDNYLIALFNKRVLNLAVPIPTRLANSSAFTYFTDKLGIATTTLNKAHKVNSNQSALTRSLEYNLSLCLLGFLFGPDGQVRPAFMADRSKDELVAA